MTFVANCRLKALSGGPAYMWNASVPASKSGGVCTEAICTDKAGLESIDFLTLVVFETDHRIACLIHSLIDKHLACRLCDRIIIEYKDYNPAPCCSTEPRLIMSVLTCSCLGESTTRHQTRRPCSLSGSARWKASTCQWTQSRGTSQSHCTQQRPTGRLIDKS